MTTILSVLAEVNAAYLDLSRWERLTVFALIVVGSTVVSYLLIEAFAFVVVKILKSLHEERVPSPIVDAFHDTYCRHCERWFYTDKTACAICWMPLQIFPDDPIGMAEAMAQTYPLPTPRSFLPPPRPFAERAAKGFDRGAQVTAFQRRTH